MEYKNIKGKRLVDTKDCDEYRFNPPAQRESRSAPELDFETGISAEQYAKMVSDIIDELVEIEKGQTKEERRKRKQQQREQSKQEREEEKREQEILQQQEEEKKKKQHRRKKNMKRDKAMRKREERERAAHQQAEQNVGKRELQDPNSEVPPENGGQVSGACNTSNLEPLMEEESESNCDEDTFFEDTSEDLDPQPQDNPEHHVTPQPQRPQLKMDPVKLHAEAMLSEMERVIAAMDDRNKLPETEALSYSETTLLALRREERKIIQTVLDVILGTDVEKPISAILLTAMGKTIAGFDAKMIRVSYLALDDNNDPAWRSGTLNEKERTRRLELDMIKALFENALQARKLDILAHLVFEEQGELVQAEGSLSA